MELARHNGIFANSPGGGDVRVERAWHLFEHWETDAKRNCFRS
jgi:hypothetical protein